MNRWAILSVLLTVSGIVFSLSVSAGNSTGSSSDDWITINKDYSSQRYVDLDQITPANLSQLKEVCEIRLNEPTMFSSGLLKVGRTLYVDTADSTVAFDAATCDLLWRKVIEVEPERSLIGRNNRGSAYFGGKIFRGTPDGRLIALDANDGHIIWENKDAADPAKYETFVSAPIAWQGKVFIGIAVSDLGIAGRLMAFDANTGNELWSFDTTLGEPAGGGFWTTYSLDPTTAEVLAPVANPFPDFSRDSDEDDDTRYTDSVISVDALNGSLNWSYQVVPEDEHDFDLAAAPTLYRTASGKDMLALSGKSGRVYGIDRTDQSLTFNTPATTLQNDLTPPTRKWTHVCPGQNGGGMFNGAAYDPDTDALYVGMVDFCAWYVKRANLGYPILGGFGGFVVKDWSSAATLRAPRGWITAIDSNSGTVLWRYHAESQVQAGMVPTKSGLLFAGDTHGNLLIFDAKNGSLLSSINTGGALNDGLISYSVNDTQYVTATVGGPTENPSTVAGPLRVVVYAIPGPSQPHVVTLDRLEPVPAPGQSAGETMYTAVCEQCHGAAGAGVSAPPLARQSQLADPELLKQFLATVPQPMPRLYPGLLNDQEVEEIAEYLKTDVFKCGPDEIQSCKPPPKPSSDGTKAWRAIYSVLTSPRCINCHPVASKLPTFPHSAHNTTFPQDYPRQDNDRHPHYYGVLRGNAIAFETAEKTGIVYPGIGAPFERCTSCHGKSNNPVTGIPGTTNPAFHPNKPFWLMAPASMAWESTPGIPLSGPQLCANLLNKKLNGNRTPDDLLMHIEYEPLVLWAYHPGIRPNGQLRTKPPISHQALIQAFKRWIAEGTPCPSN
jgi:alcohol dehydrogenase (cytochrome c)